MKTETFLPAGYMILDGGAELVIRTPDGSIVKVPRDVFNRLLTDTYEAKFTAWWDAQIDKEIKGSGGLGGE